MTIEEKAREIFVTQNCMECENASDEAWMKRDAFQRGANWMLEKAIDWLKSNVGKYPEINWDQQEWYSNKERLIKDFKQAMEE